MQKRLSEWLPEGKLRGTVSKQPARYPSGTLWPHGEWSMGWASERPDGGGNDGAAWYVPDSVVEREMTPGWAEGLPFDLSDAANSHNRAKRGLKGITGYGQQMVKAAGYLLQQKYPCHRLTMGTITFPEMSQAARQEMVRAWPEILRQLLQWQSRRLRRLGLPPVVVSVSEIQPKRFAESGQAVLHLHQLWPNVPAKHGQWSFSPNLVRAFISRLLMRTCPSYRWGFINVDTRPVAGEAARYLAKYMSKGKQSIAEALDDWGEDNCPSTWWNMTKPARDMVKAATRRGRDVGMVLEECFEHACRVGFDDVYAFLAPVFVEFDNSRIIMGWRGRFQEDVFGHLTRVLESFDIERFIKAEN